MGYMSNNTYLQERKKLSEIFNINNIKFKLLATKELKYNVRVL